MLVVAVGRRLGQPQKQCKDAVFPVYISISIYIYIYIYAFPFPVSHQGQYVAAGTSVLTRRIQNEGPFLTVLWLGLDQKRQHLFTEVRIPVASCPSPPGMGLFLYIRQLWLPACQDAEVWPP